jgi:hypothetical protein
MTLQFSNLDQVYPGWSDMIERNLEITNTVLNIKEISEKIKNGDKLRFVNGKLEIDKRHFKCVTRMISKDSRNKTFKILKNVMDETHCFIEKSYIIKIFEKLSKTYPNDPNFKKYAIKEKTPLKKVSMTKDISIGLLKIKKSQM